jgi:hypothetical protein
MRKRIASINDLAINEKDRLFFLAQGLDRMIMLGFLSLGFKRSRGMHFLQKTADELA